MIDHGAARSSKCAGAIEKGFTVHPEKKSNVKKENGDGQRSAVQ